MTPTQRSLAHLRQQGVDLVQVVEKWNPHARIRQDLFGVIDILAIREGETIGVQATSASNVSSRVRKLEESDALIALRAAGWTVLVHGWRKGSDGRWQLKEVDLS